MAVIKEYYDPNNNYNQKAKKHTFQDLYDTTDALDKGEIGSVLAGQEYTETSNRKGSSFSTRNLFATNADEFSSILGGVAGTAVGQYNKKKKLQADTASKGFGGQSSILGGGNF